MWLPQQRLVRESEGWPEAWELWPWVLLLPWEWFFLRLAEPYSQAPVPTRPNKVCPSCWRQRTARFARCQPNREWTLIDPPWLRLRFPMVHGHEIKPRMDANNCFYFASIRGLISVRIIRFHSSFARRKLIMS